ncbi:MAG TPA: glycosyltransferase family 2 protein [Phycisphaerales bacterium]|nr:glycosyltransferase family 2 protein [Phycisphaerales bacterium]
MNEQITIIIPAYNESQSISGVVRSIIDSEQSKVKEVIVVDDGSTDNTAELAEGAGATVIRHARNKGYGASLKTGITAATSSHVMTFDADGQHETADISRLAEHLGKYDMIIGERTQSIHSPMWRMPGKWLLGIMINLIIGKKIPDFNSGLRLMNRKIVKQYMHVCPQGFSFSTTITMVLHYRGYGIKYVPIQVKKRAGKSEVNVRTGLDTAIRILRIATLCNPLRLLLPIAIGFEILGLAWSLPILLDGRGLSTGGVLLITIGVIVFVLGLISDQISQLRLERFE